MKLFLYARAHAVGGLGMHACKKKYITYLNFILLEIYNEKIYTM